MKLKVLALFFHLSKFQNLVKRELLSEYLHEKRSGIEFLNPNSFCSSLQLNIKYLRITIRRSTVCKRNDLHTKERCRMSVIIDCTDRVIRNDTKSMR